MLLIESVIRAFISDELSACNRVIKYVIRAFTLTAPCGCMMKVESWHESSATLSGYAIIPLKTTCANYHASSRFWRTSYWKTEIHFHAQTDRVGHGQLFLVCLDVSSTSDTGTLGGLALCITCCKFGEVSVVVNLHFVVKHLRLPSACRWDEVLVHHHEDAVKSLLESSFHFGEVLPRVLGDPLLVALDPFIHVSSLRPRWAPRPSRPGAAPLPC